MSEEFILEDEVSIGIITHTNSRQYRFYAEEKVKEFIRKERELLRLLSQGKITWADFWMKRDKLIGKDLI